jgi:hypothetical protein
MNKVFALLLLTATLHAQSTIGCSPGVNGCGMLSSPFGPAQTIASASTIAPSGVAIVITGTAAIATITPPAGALNGCIDVLATGAWTTTTGGNIFATMTAVANTTYRACYMTVSGLPSGT